MKRKIGIGLYSYEQEKYVTPFQYFSQIAVGACVFLFGATLAFAQYHAPTPNIWGYIGAAALSIIGIFFAHAGVIFWFKKLIRWR